MGNCFSPKEREIEQCFKETFLHSFMSSDDVRRSEGYFRHLTTRYLKNLNILDCRILYVVQGEISLFFAPRSASCYDKCDPAAPNTSIFTKLATYGDANFSYRVQTLRAGDYCILFGDDLHYTSSEYHTTNQFTAVCTSRETCSYVSITYPRLVEFLQMKHLSPLRSLLTTRMSALLSLSEEFQYLSEEQLDMIGATMRVVHIKNRCKIMEFGRVGTSEDGGYCAVLLLGSWVKRSPPYRGSELFSAYSLHDTELIETLPDNSIRSSRRNSTQRRLTENIERTVSQKIKSTFRSSNDSRDSDAGVSTTVLSSGAVIGMDLCLLKGARGLYTVATMSECVVGMISKSVLQALSPMENSNRTKTFTTTGHNSSSSSIVGTLTNNMKADLFESVIEAIPLFWGISTREITALASTAEVHIYNTGDTVFQQGDAGELFYMLIHGAVEVYVSNTLPGGTLDRPRLMKHLTAPNYFGEIALISSEKRGATIIATSYTLLLSISKSSFQSIFTRTHEPLSELNIRLYGENVDLLHILRHGKGVAAFKTYLQKIHAVEMLLFWLDVDKFEQAVSKQYNLLSSETTPMPKPSPYRQRSTYIRDEHDRLPNKEAVNMLMGLVYHIMETYIEKDTKYQINISRMMMESLEAEHSSITASANDILNAVTDSTALVTPLLLRLQQLFCLPKKEMFYLMRDGCYLRWKQSDDFREFILGMQPYKMH